MLGEHSKARMAGCVLESGGENGHLVLSIQVEQLWSFKRNFSQEITGMNSKVICDSCWVRIFKKQNYVDHNKRKVMLGKTSNNSHVNIREQAVQGRWF